MCHRPSRSGRSIAWIAATTVMLGAVSADSAELLPLRVSGNHRYLEDTAGRPFFLIGDCPQNLPLKLSIAELDAYMADCQQKGFSLLWICIDGQRTASPTSNPPRDRNGTLMMSDGWRISSLNPAYFVTIDAISSHAERHDIYCMFTPLSECQWTQRNINNNSAANWYAYGKFLGDRYKTRPNIIWQFGNDTINEAAQHEIVRGIKEAGDEHLMTVNWRPGHYREGSGWLRKFEHGESWIDLNAWYINAPVDKGGAACYWQKIEYERPDPMPSFPTETQYQAPYAKATDLECRMQNYHTALGGGCGGQVYGSGWLADDADYETYRNLGGRMQTIHFKTLFCNRSWWTLVPDYAHTFITAGYGTLSRSTRDYVGAAANDTLAMAYCPNTRAITANLARFSAPVSARWYDPTDGTYREIAGSPMANAGKRSFTPPAANARGETDWVLVLEVAGKRKSIEKSIFANR
jgi:hypothetical protein